MFSSLDLIDEFNQLNILLKVLTYLFRSDWIHNYWDTLNVFCILLASADMHMHTYVCACTCVRTRANIHARTCIKSVSPTFRKRLHLFLARNSMCPHNMIGVLHKQPHETFGSNNSVFIPKMQGQSITKECYNLMCYLLYNTIQLKAIYDDTVK